MVDRRVDAAGSKYGVDESVYLLMDAREVVRITEIEHARFAAWLRSMIKKGRCEKKAYSPVRERENQVIVAYIIEAAVRINASIRLYGENIHEKSVLAYLRLTYCIG